MDGDNAKIYIVKNFGMIIFFDIETISIFWKDHRNSIELPNLYADLQEKYGENFNFMPEFHKILTITTGVRTTEWIITKNLEWNEPEMIQRFFEIAEKNSLCGFNIKGFDIPFIVKRALLYGIPLPNSLKLFGKKPWDMENFIDLYEVYKHTGYKSGSLDLISNFLSVPTPKNGIDGSQVQTFHDEWKDDEIREYCKRDVEATILVYEKFKSLNLM